MLYSVFCRIGVRLVKFARIGDTSGVLRFYLERP
jgi:hypothetical protein